MKQSICKREFTGRFHLEAFSENGVITIEVVKTTNGQPIPKEEPVFLLRARDLLASPLLLCYRALIRAASYPSSDAKLEHLDSNEILTEKFERFRAEYAERMKLPNVTRGK